MSTFTQVKEGKLGENAKSGFASLSSKVTSGWSDFSNMWSDGPQSKALTDGEDSEQTGLASGSNKKFVLPVSLFQHRNRVFVS